MQRLAKTEKNNSREIVYVIWSLDEVMRKSLRGWSILGGYVSTRAKHLMLGINYKTTKDACGKICRG